MQSQTRPQTRPRGIRPAAIVLASFCLVGACAESATPTSPSPTSEEQLTLKITTPHFRLLADRAPQATLQAIADALEAAYPRMTADLRVTGLPEVTVSVWQDHASFYSAMQRNLGQVYTGSAGYVMGRQGVAVLAVASVAGNATHEFAHVVSLAVNPSIGNNPRWLWETLALFENGEFVDPASLSFIQAGQYPTLASLNATYGTNQQVYQVGYVLGEFIVSAWNMDGLLALLRHNGQTQDAVGVSTTEFERRWYAFLQAKYRTPPPR